MTDYIANSKNRKLKKRIMLFLSRLDFGREKLPFAGKMILFLDGILFLSLFFSWFHFTYIDNSVTSFSAFSVYTGYIWYALFFAILAIPFFLLSHTKKEMIRAYIPFRLSDTQAIVFIVSMILTGLLHLMFMSRTFHQFTIDIRVWNGFILSLTTSICILVSAYFLSRQSKQWSVEVRYIDHTTTDSYGEYGEILKKPWDSNDLHDSNMKLPI
jgi:hypothetical protein